jgi:hypothetical protein
MGIARPLVAAVAVRIEAGPGGPDTDRWFIDVEVGPGVAVRDVDALALTLVGTLVGDLDRIADALRAQSAVPAA